MKKILALVLALVLVFALCACGQQAAPAAAPAAEPVAPAAEPAAPAAEKALVGISLPTKSLQRWNQDGDYLTQSLQGMGYEVDLQFAEDKSELQVSQIDNLITKGAKVIIVSHGPSLMEKVPWVII